MGLHDFLNFVYISGYVLMCSLGSGITYSPYAAVLLGFWTKLFLEFICQAITVFSTVDMSLLLESLEKVCVKDKLKELSGIFSVAIGYIKKLDYKSQDSSESSWIKGLEIFLNNTERADIKNGDHTKEEGQERLIINNNDVGHIKAKIIKKIEEIIGNELSYLSENEKTVISDGLSNLQLEMEKEIKKKYLPPLNYAVFLLKIFKNSKKKNHNELNEGGVVRKSLFQLLCSRIGISRTVYLMICSVLGISISYLLGLLIAFLGMMDVAKLSEEYGYMMTSVSIFSKIGHNAMKWYVMVTVLMSFYILRYFEMRSKKMSKFINTMFTSITCILTIYIPVMLGILHFCGGLTVDIVKKNIINSGIGENASKSASWVMAAKGLGFVYYNVYNNFPIVELYTRNIPSESKNPLYFCKCSILALSTLFILTTATSFISSITLGEYIDTDIMTFFSRETKLMEVLNKEFPFRSKALLFVIWSYPLVWFGAGYIYLKSFIDETRKFRETVVEEWRRIKEKVENEDRLENDKNQEANCTVNLEEENNEKTIGFIDWNLVFDNFLVVFLMGGLGYLLGKGGDGIVNTIISVCSGVFLPVMCFGCVFYFTLTFAHPNVKVIGKGYNWISSKLCTYISVLFVALCVIFIFSGTIYEYSSEGRVQKNMTIENLVENITKVEEVASSVKASTRIYGPIIYNRAIGI